MEILAIIGFAALALGIVWGASWLIARVQMHEDRKRRERERIEREGA